MAWKSASHIHGTRGHPLGIQGIVGSGVRLCTIFMGAGGGPGAPRHSWERLLAEGDLCPAVTGALTPEEGEKETIAGSEPGCAGMGPGGDPCLLPVAQQVLPPQGQADVSGISSSQALAPLPLCPGNGVEGRETQPPGAAGPL